MNLSNKLRNFDGFIRNCKKLEPTSGRYTRFEIQLSTAIGVLFASGKTPNTAAETRYKIPTKIDLEENLRQKFSEKRT